MTKEERDKLIEDYARIIAERKAAGSLPEDERLRIKAERRAILAKYFAGLPRLEISRCPFTGEVLQRAFDPWGVDGFWWQEGIPAIEHEEPAAPASFLVLSGALNLGDQPPLGGELADAHVGPDVPFVVPALLEHPTVTAVISSIPMECGYTAYPIAYFCKKAPPLVGIHAWTETTFSYKDSKGHPFWGISTDPWDFDLEPWIERKKVRWIEPGDEALTVRSGSPSQCPYVGLPGIRKNQVLLGDRLVTKAPPSGEEVSPFE
jgi:hypothetical protein